MEAAAAAVVEEPVEVPMEEPHAEVAGAERLHEMLVAGEDADAGTETVEQGSIRTVRSSVVEGALDGATLHLTAKERYHRIVTKYGTGGQKSNGCLVLVKLSPVLR